MVKDMILVDREALLTELQTVFDPQTADTLLSVLDKVATQVRAAGVTHEDFSELKQIVADLAEAQRRSEERLSGVEERLSGVEERLSGVEERLERLERAVAELVEVQRKHEERLHKIEDDVGKLKGYMLESRYRDRTPSYFGRWLRRAKVVDLNNLWETLETYLSEEELEEISALDLIITGKLKNQPEGEALYLAVEISSIMDKHDVQRARQRAELLQRAGYRAIPVAAGEDATEGAEKEARKQKVVMLHDGRSLLWDEALARWVKS